MNIHEKCICDPLTSTYCMEAPTESVESPSHYTQGKIEVIDFIEDQKLDFRLANVIKYICRAAYKGEELQDLKKAKWYLERVIEEKSKEIRDKLESVYSRGGK